MLRNFTILKYLKVANYQDWPIFDLSWCTTKIGIVDCGKLFWYRAQNYFLLSLAEGVSANYLWL